MNVLIKEDYNSEMREIYVNGTLYQIGNFWDFKLGDTLEDLLKKFGVTVVREEYKYGD